MNISCRTECMNPVIAWYRFDSTSSSFTELEQISSKESDTDEKKILYCWLCKHFITDENESISVFGNHSHTRTNPARIKFNFRCFINARGCNAIGEAVEEHTWFPGYKWQIAVCSGCGEHLGWLFRGATRFYGLIAERIISGPNK